jgi:hypothetical protein
MNQRILWLTVLALAIPAGIAAQSIHPFFQPDDLVFRPELLGEWKFDGDSLEFRDLGEKTYGAVLRPDHQSAILFRVRLFQIEQKYFMDAQLTNIKQADPACLASDGAHEAAPILVSDSDFELDGDNSFFANHQHLLLRVSPSEDKNEFQLAFQTESWLRAQEEAGKLSVPHTRDDNGRLLFVAESDDLRVWVRELPDEAFEAPMAMQRAEAKEDAGDTTAQNSKL